VSVDENGRLQSNFDFFRFRSHRFELADERNRDVTTVRPYPIRCNHRRWFCPRIHWCKTALCTFGSPVDVHDRLRMLGRRTFPILGSWLPQTANLRLSEDGRVPQSDSRIMSGGPQAVWNPTAIGIVAIQILFAVTVISATLIIQSKKLSRTRFGPRVMKMQKTERLVWILRLIVAVVAIGCAATFVPWDAACTYFAPLPDTVQEQVEDALRHGMNGIIVFVDQAGREPAFYAAGWKDRQSKVAADPHALFKIGSISKLYIAVAAAKLVSAKRLSLDDTLAHYLPELAGRIENADKITLRMMLRHCSGIANFTDGRRFRWDKAVNATEVLNLVLDKPAEFEPDSRYSSNTNYLLIGKILDKTLGHSHQDYIKAEILAPLGLTHTYSLLSEVDAADVVIALGKSGR
jgi:hypothetical protein